MVIDVLRAFSTACYALAAGASDITLVAEVEEAMALSTRIPGSRTFGEAGGVKVKAFDYGNSPAEFEHLNLRGVHLIQRTSSGTQGAVRSNQASTLLAASFCCAYATERVLQRLKPETVTFVATGITEDGKGDEDLALAEYLTERLRGKKPDPQPYLGRITGSLNAHILRSEKFRAERDIELSAQLDRFSFALPVERESGRLVMRKLEQG